MNVVKKIWIMCIVFIVGFITICGNTNIVFAQSDTGEEQNNTSEPQVSLEEEKKADVDSTLDTSMVEEEVIVPKEVKPLEVKVVESKQDTDSQFPIHRMISKARSIEEGTTDTRFFTFDGATLTGFSTIIDDVSENAPKDIVIPKTYINTLGLEVTITKIGDNAFAGRSGYIDSIQLNDNLIEIGDNAFKNLSTITNVRIPDTVTTIGMNAFEGCSSLSTVTLGNGLSVIKDRAFIGTAIQEITFPASITSIGASSFQNLLTLKKAIFTQGVMPATIGVEAFKASGLLEIDIADNYASLLDSAFAECASLTKVTLPEQLQTAGKQLFQKSGLTSIVIPNTVKTIPIEMFIDCKNLTSVDLGNGIEKIDEKAFKNSGVTSVTIPNSVTTIGNGAFESCKSLTTVVMGNKVDTLGGSSFYSTAITSITLPDTLLEIRPVTFGNCKSLTTVTLGNRVTKIGDRAFQGSAITKIEIPNTTKEIGVYAFNECAQLNTVTMGSNVERIYVGAFFQSGVTSIVLPNSLKIIESDVFRACKSLTNVTLGNAVELIENGAFAYSNLKNISIPDSVVTIEKEAFMNSGLETVTLGSGLKTIEEAVFKGTKLSEITIPASIEEIAINALETNTINTINVNVNFNSIVGKPWGAGEAKIRWADEDSYIGHFFYKDGQILGIKNLPETDCVDTALHEGGVLVIPSSIDGQTITGIADYAFQYSKFTEVTLPDTVTSIGVNAFYKNTSIYKLNMGTGVKTIQSYAFSGCSNLQSATIVSDVETIGDYAFSNTYITSMNLPNSVTSIGANAFESCGMLRTVTLGNKIEKIGKYAFCGTKIESIEIPDTMTEIEEGVFLGAKLFKSITLGKNIEHIGNKAFSGTVLAEIALPDKVKTIGSEAFAENAVFHKISFSPVLDSIGDSAFSGTAITEISLPDSLASIGNSAFTSCTKLYNVQVGENLKTVGKNAFENTAVKEIVFPDTFRTLGTEAFKRCSQLSKIYLGKTLELIPSMAFMNSGLTEITIPSTVKKIDTSAFENCSRLNAVSFDTATSRSIGSSELTTIASKAFKATRLSGLVIPDSVTQIEDEAFSGCGQMEYVVLGESTSSLGVNSFSYTSALTKLTLNKNLKTIGNGAFANAASLVNIDFSKASTLETIGKLAFAESRLATIQNIPSSVTSIDAEAFKNAPVKTITIDTLRADCSYRDNEPWGATDAKTYYKNEFIDMQYTIKNNGAKRVVECTFQSTEEAGLITKIYGPGYSDGITVSDDNYSGSFEVRNNGVFSFEAVSSANVTFAYVVSIDDIGNIEMTGNDIVIRKDVLDTLSLKQLLAFGNVEAYIIDTKENVPVTTDKTIAQILTALDADGKTIQIKASAQTSIGKIKSRTLNITVSDSAHIVSFLDGGNVLRKQSVLNNAKIQTWTPTKGGYGFKNFYSDAALSTPWDVSNGVTKDETLYIGWTPNVYTIAYHTDVEGVTIDNLEDVSVESNNILPTTLIKKPGYTLSGWKYKNVNITDRTVLKNIITDEAQGATLTLDAQWVENKYSIAYDTGIAGETITPITNCSISAKNLVPETEYEKVGYTQGEWKYKGKTVTKDTLLETILTDEADGAEIKLVLDWKLSKYTIKYSSEFTDLTPPDITNVDITSETSLIPTLNMVKAGYTFVDWKFDTTSITSSTRVADLITNQKDGATISIKANWQLNKYLIGYDTGIEGIEIEDLTNKTLSDKNLLPDTTLTKKGYTLTGWKCNNSIVTKDTMLVNVLTNEPDGTRLVFVAQWTPNKYTITYNTGFKDVLVPKLSNVTITDENLIPSAPKKQGYTFENWTYNGIPIQSTTKFSEILGNEGAGASFSFKASWVKNSYAVNFAFIGASPVDVPNSQTVKYLETAQKPTLMSVDKWVFKGWYTDKACTKRFTFDSPIKTSMNLYGKWVQNDDKPNEDIENPDKDIETGGQVVKPKPPVDKDTTSTTNNPTKEQTNQQNRVDEETNKDDSKTTQKDVQVEVIGTIPLKDATNGLTAQQIRSFVRVFDTSGDVQYSILSSTYQKDTNEYKVEISLRNGTLKSIQIPVEKAEEEKTTPTTTGEKSDCIMHFILLAIFACFIVYAWVSISRAKRDGSVQANVMKTRYGVSIIAIIGMSVTFVLCTCSFHMMVYLPCLVITILGMLYFMYQNKQISNTKE